MIPPKCNNFWCLEFSYFFSWEFIWILHTQIPSDPAGLPEASSIHNLLTKPDVSVGEEYREMLIWSSFEWDTDKRCCFLKLLKQLSWMSDT